jgi:hypothetical protein
LAILESRADELIPVEEYIHRDFVPISHLAHGWEMHSAVALSRVEDRTMIREPVQAIPQTIAARIGRTRILAVPYISCLESGDAVSFRKPSSDTHTAVWQEVGGVTYILLASRELDAHDTGFELLAATAEILRGRLTEAELNRYGELLDEELRQGIKGEIDEDALAAKAPFSSRGWRRNRARLETYRNVSFCSTVAEYIHGMWHDVQIRVGPEHLPLPQLRKRLELLAEMFPPNEGYGVFDPALEKSE